MNTDVEELLKDGMERFTAGVRAPAGLVQAVTADRRQRRRRLAIRGAAACGAAAATVAAVLAVSAGTSAPARTGGTITQARDVAYLVHRVEKALTGTHLVFQGQTTSKYGPSTGWAYGNRSRFEEFTGLGCGHALPSGWCTHRGGSERYLTAGTALVDGKLVGAYVTYFDHKYSLSKVVPPPRACSTTARLEMGGPGVPTTRWADFISATLACGAARVTGHVWIDGVRTTRITGSPVTVKLVPGYAKVVRERYVRTTWTMYVNPATYLPVRIEGSTQSFGGSPGMTAGLSVTNVQWLPPTRANIAKATVIIPPGYEQESSPANQ